MTQPVKFTMLFSRSDAFATDDLMTALGRSRGRKVDKSEAIRELLHLAAEDADIRLRLLRRLNGV